MEMKISFSGKLGQGILLLQDTENSICFSIMSTKGNNYVQILQIIVQSTKLPESKFNTGFLMNPTNFPFDI